MQKEIEDLTHHSCNANGFFFFFPFRGEQYSCTTHYWAGLEVWEVPPQLVSLFDRCLDNHIAMQRDRPTSNTRALIVDDPLIEEGRETVKTKWRNDFRHKRHHNPGLVEHLDRLEAGMNDPEDVNAEYYEIIWKDAVNSLKILYSERPPNLDDQDEVDAFVDNHLVAVREAYDKVEGGKQKSRHTKERAKLRKQVASSMQVNANLQKLRQSPLARDQKQVYEDALKDIEARTRRKLFKDDDEEEEEEEEPAATGGTTAQSPPPPPPPAGGQA